MKKKILVSALLLAASFSAFGAAACAKNSDAGKTEQTKTVEYKGEMLYNGFDTVKDMYAVNQLYEWNYSPLGKLEIVSAAKFGELSSVKEGETGKNESDLSPRQGEGALRVYYKGGTFTELLARFDRSALAGLPVDELGRLSVKIYNDSGAEKKVTLSLMREKNKVLELENGEFTLAPYSWTECVTSFDPVITEYFKNELIGVNVRFTDVTDSVYYLDDMRITFGKIYTDEITARLNRVAELEKDIDELEGKTVTEADKETISELYTRYAEFTQAYRAIVKNSETLFSAADAYFAAVNAREEEDGKKTALFADEITGLRQFADFNGGSVSYTAEEGFGEESGAIKIDFNGSTDNTTIEISPSVASGYDEFRIKVKNDSDLKRAIYLNWETFGYAVNENGEKVSLLGGYVLPANSGWLELVFTVQTDISQLNSASLTNAGNAVTKSVGTLYIGRSYAVSHAKDVLDAIEALKDYSSAYTAADKAAAASAREAYDALCPDSQDKITNLNKLEKIEAEIWKEGFKLLPASAEEITGYNANYKAAAEALRKGYIGLSAGVKKLVENEEKRLAEFEERLLLFRKDYVKELIAAAAVKTDYSVNEIKNIRIAESKYAELTEEEKSAFTAAEIEKLNSLIAATSKYYTLKDLGGVFSSDIIGAPSWGAYSAELKNDKEGVIVFGVRGLAAADGALYVSIFHDASVNASQASDGIACMLRNTSSLKKLLLYNAGNKEIGFNGGVLSKTETYTFYYGYKLADDNSSLTVSVKVTDESGAVVAEGTHEITTFELQDFGSQTIESWLGGDKGAERRTFFISAGASEPDILSVW